MKGKATIERHTRAAINKAFHEQYVIKRLIAGEITEPEARAKLRTTKKRIAELRAFYQSND
jgi:hypothetical protein